MNSLIIQSSVLLIGLIFVPSCETRWKFLDSNGHRIRHNRYWKLQYSDRDTSHDCPPSRNSVNFRLCPSKSCGSDRDCWTSARRLLRCTCDKALCGRVCVPVDASCEYPYGFTNGVISMKPNNRIGSEVTYRCYEGYRLEGLSKRVCQANNLWSGEAPKCVPETFCTTPPIVSFAENDVSKNDKFPTGATVTYQCRQGFVANGLNFRSICGADGRWIKPQIQCKPIKCGHPGILPNGRFIAKNFVYPENAVFFCNEGYKIRCDNQTECQIRECQADGRWSGHPPTCQPIHCPRLKAPVNGRVSGMWTKVNSILAFYCYPGYYLVGSRTRRCQRNGKWDGTDATCKILNCGLPPYVVHSRINYTDTVFGSTATYRCFSNSRFYGISRTLKCGSDGKWKPKPINCLKVCNSMKVPNESVQDDRQRFKIVPCRGGYLLRKPLFPDCVNGSWSKSAQCQPAPCLNKLPMGANSQAFYYSLEHGSVARFNCTFGYRQASGNDVLRCHYGTWNGTPPVCKPSTCSRPPVPLNGKIYLVGIYGRWLYSVEIIHVQHDDVVEYECRTGYVLKGQRRTVCQNGEWHPSTTPRCELMTNDVSRSDNNSEE